MSTAIKQLGERRWYVARGSLPIQLTVSSTNDNLCHWITGTAHKVASERLFETEREALEYALKQKKEAREMVEREYAAIVNRLDRVDAMEEF